ncbi:aldo/keto reductase [Alkaliphilus oremlandii OhILAs]|uniref:Aldo/keto reductase n=2 Tax=Alkaliphilus oremlandii TaxID=461876 RepID=A8MF92_ALKOO|nr:aldo/keto reductase [Alkaliphilus oremlandii OhILAs]
MMSFNEIKKLGFGFMRLPMNGSEVDIEQTKEMVDLFMERGFTYFDTAYGYMEGKSEEALKTSLVDRYPRESFQIATKLPAWYGVKTQEEAQNMFWTSLKRIGVEYFDFYLLHNLGENRTKYFDDFDIWNFLADKKEQGLIKNLGFSFHDRAHVLDEILTKHPEVDFVQLQINYADWESDTVESRKCYEVARKHNKPIVIMEPVKGGSLANLPEPIPTMFQDVNPDASVSSWAIRYAASLDGIITVLSGMSNVTQMEDNLSYMEHFKPVTDEEVEVIKKVQKILDTIPRIPCTDCKYCVKGCPQSISIPGVFKAMNTNLVYNNTQGARNTYSLVTRRGGKASSCIECGQCEDACPQHIHIIDELKVAAGIFE